MSESKQAVAPARKEFIEREEEKNFMFSHYVLIHAMSDNNKINISAKNKKNELKSVYK
jgi:hypothetical protein